MYISESAKFVKKVSLQFSKNSSNHLMRVMMSRETQHMKMISLSNNAGTQNLFSETYDHFVTYLESFTCISKEIKNFDMVTEELKLMIHIEIYVFMPYKIVAITTQK